MEKRNSRSHFKIELGVLKPKKSYETEKEAFSRMVVLNAIAGTYDLSASMPNSVRNLTTIFNATYGTSYTTQVILEQHFEELPL